MDFYTNKSKKVDGKFIDLLNMIHFIKHIVYFNLWGKVEWENIYMYVYKVSY